MLEVALKATLAGRVLLSCSRAPSCLSGARGCHIFREILPLLHMFSISMTEGLRRLASINLIRRASEAYVIGIVIY